MIYSKEEICAHIEAIKTCYDIEITYEMSDENGVKVGLILFQPAKKYDSICVEEGYLSFILEQDNLPTFKSKKTTELYIDDKRLTEKCRENWIETNDSYKEQSTKQLINELYNLEISTAEKVVINKELSNRKFKQ